MPDLAAVTPGVQFTPPPVELQPAITRAIEAAVASIPPGKSGALVGIVNEYGANAALVTKLGGAWEVQAWIGKSWRAKDLQYGASVKAAW